MNIKNDIQTIRMLRQSARTKNTSIVRPAEKYQNLGPIPKKFIRLDPWEIDYLYIVAKTAKKGILETGRLMGGSTVLLSLANQNVPIYSIDINPVDDVYARQVMDLCGVGINTHLIEGDSQKSKYDIILGYDVLFVDGDHSFDGCLNDLNNWWDDLPIGGHVILHDCYFGSPVQEAVIEFLREKKVRIHTTPFIPVNHSMVLTGSLCHFQKEA